MDLSWGQCRALWQVGVAVPPCNCGAVTGGGSPGLRLSPSEQSMSSPCPGTKAGGERVLGPSPTSLRQGQPQALLRLQRTREASDALLGLIWGPR